MARSATSPAPSASEEMTLAIETVTPAQAKRWLEVDNHRNRKIRDFRISYLSDEINAERWQTTHLGIAFDPKGNLLDGQHRLAAIAKAGKPVRIVVARNVPAEAYIAMDRGSVRSIADVLRRDQQSVLVATSITRHVQLTSYSSGSVAPEDVQMVSDALENEIALANSVRRSRPLLRVQLRSALALRLAMAPGAWCDLLMEQWRALNQTDTPKMDATSASLLRRLVTERVTVADRMMVLGWQAFDPAQRERQQFHLDLSAYREMVTAARRLLRDRIKTFHEEGSRLERALATAHKDATGSA